MRERPNRRAWKAREAQASVGSNPTPSATSIIFSAVFSSPLVSEKITFRRDERFTYFFCDEFLTRIEAAALLEAFPDDLLRLQISADRSHAAISDRGDHVLFNTVVSRSAFLLEVSDWFRSSQFIEDVLTTFREAILGRYPLVIRRLLRKWILNPTRYYGEVQFSMRDSMHILSPHTDNADKVLSLVIYLPETEESLELGGTAFYLPKSKSGERAVFRRYSRRGAWMPPQFKALSSTKLPMSESTDSSKILHHLHFFDSHYDRVFDAPYRLGAAGGFIKNQFSWHDLRLSSLSPVSTRRSLLVNVFIRPSKLRALANVVLRR